MKRFIVFVAALSMFLFGVATVRAEDANVDEKRERLERLEDELDSLREDIETLKESGGGHGGGFSSGKTTLGGYGELHFSDYKNVDKPSVVDFHRFVLFIGHEVNDWITLETEFELEHALSGDGKKGEVELEQAFLDFHLSKAVNVRTGLFLLPIGITNEHHEPPTFYGVERPDVDKNVIPTTWWEAGAGIHGEVAPGLKYKLYLVSSLDAAGFKASSGIRSGRQKVSKAVAEDFAITGRLEYSAIKGLKLGGSFFSGNTSQNVDALGDAKVTLLEADVQYTIDNFEFKGLYATVDIDDADKISAFTGETVGEEIVGWYVEGAYRFMEHLLPKSDQELAVFLRYSEYNTQEEVASGFMADGKNDIQVTTIGIDYKPHPSVVIKADFQDRDNNSSTVEATDQFNVGVGYMF